MSDQASGIGPNAGQYLTTCSTSSIGAEHKGQPGGNPLQWWTRWTSVMDISIVIWCLMSNIANRWRGFNWNEIPKATNFLRKSSPKDIYAGSILNFPFGSVQKGPSINCSYNLLSWRRTLCTVSRVLIWIEWSSMHEWLSSQSKDFVGCRNNLPLSWYLFLFK